MLSFIDPEHITLIVDDRRFLVQRDNMISLLYAYRGYASKPYIPVLSGPSGRNVLEDSPGDHVHHHGVWWGHGDVNGIDFYLEVPAPDRRLGRIEHVDFREIIDERPHFGFVQQLRWVADDGATLIEEERALHAHFVDQSHYTVDLDSTYTACTDIEFGDTKESVLPGIRIAEALTGVCGGHIRTSDGGRGENQTMGKPAAWLDYWGNRTATYGLGELAEGIACLDHPSNPNHPNPFFSRAYGPISPFQGNYFTGPSKLGDGESMRYRHRLIVHYGDTEEAQIAAKYDEWTREAQ